MATTITCDGCDKALKKPARRDEITEDFFGATLTLARNGHGLLVSEALDLCKSCVERLRNDADPRRWLCASRNVPEHRPSA